MENRAAWAGAWGVLTALFGGFALAAHQAGSGAGNQVPEPAFVLLIVAGVGSAYLMIAALAHWPPYRRSPLTPPELSPNRPARVMGPCPRQLPNQVEERGKARNVDEGIRTEDTAEVDGEDIEME